LILGKSGELIYKIIAEIGISRIISQWEIGRLGPQGYGPGVGWCMVDQLVVHGGGSLECNQADEEAHLLLP
jgi:hypothetical protein